MNAWEQTQAWLAAKPTRTILMCHAKYQGKPGLFVQLLDKHNGPHPNDVTGIAYGDDMAVMLAQALKEIGG